jgi:hypothetical protein
MNKPLPTLPKKEQPEVVTKQVKVAKQPIIIPILYGMDEGYCPRHAYVRMSQNQALTLNRIRLAMGSDGRRLNNGKAVQSAADVLLWMIEEITRESAKA